MKFETGGFLVHVQDASLDSVVEHRRLRAAGEGQADDNDALQSALDACASEGGTVTVPSGTYVTGTLRIGSHHELPPAAGATKQVQLHLTAA